MDVAATLKTSPLVNAGTVNPDIVLGKPYIEFTVNREAAFPLRHECFDGQSSD